VELERTKGRTLAGEAAAPEEEVAQSPMYGVALLKIAMELKRTPAAGLETREGRAGRMRLDEPAFRVLEQNGGLLGPSRREL
jgi:hypothetical protein